MKKKLLLLLVIFVVTGCGSSSVPVRNFEANLLGLQPEDYTELHFDLAYPETLQIDGMKDGKIYFQYLDSLEVHTGRERYNFTAGNVFRNAAGIYDIEKNSYQSGIYVEDDLASKGIFDVISSYKNHLIMDNETGYFTSALGTEIFSEEYRLYTYAIDYVKHTRKIKKDYGTYRYAAPYPLLYDKEHFFIYFEDEGKTQATIYHYDTVSDEATPVIIQPEGVQFVTAMVEKKWIWVYVLDLEHNNDKNRPYHYLYQYQVDGTIQKIYPIPDEIVNNRNSSTDVFMPSTMKRFSKNIFYLEDFGFLNHFFLKLGKEGFEVLPSFYNNKRLRMLPQTGNLSAKKNYFYSHFREVTHILEFDERKEELMEFTLPNPYEGSNIDYLFQYYTDEKGNLLAVIKRPLLWKVEDLPLSEYLSEYLKVYFIPQKTMKKYFSKLNP